MKTVNTINNIFSPIITISTTFDSIYIHKNALSHKLQQK